MFITIKAEHERGTGEIQLTTFGVYESLAVARNEMEEYSQMYCDAHFDAHTYDNETSVELHDEFGNWVKLLVFDTDVTCESERPKMFWQGERGLLATHELDGGDDLFYEEE